MNVSETVRKMILVMASAGLVFSVVGVVASFYYPIILPVPFTLGVMLSTLLNCIKAVMLENTVTRIVEMSDEHVAANYLKMQALLRFALTAAVLLLGVFVPFIDLWGVVAGIFTFHVGKYSLGFIVKNDFTEDTQK